MLQVVASFAEAWIENTLLRLAEQNVTGVASFAEAWIENTASIFPLDLGVLRRLLRGGVD